MRNEMECTGICHVEIYQVVSKKNKIIKKDRVHDKIPIYD